MKQENSKPDPLDIKYLRELIALHGPPGQEDEVRQTMATLAEAFGCVTEVDPRGNLLIAPPGVAAIPQTAEIVVMAHLDEIALIVQRFEDDGRLVVAPLGGVFPWKWGEGPVSILCVDGPLTGILSFGSIHSSSHENAATRAREEPLTWDMTRVFTGMTVADLKEAGVRPGTRIVMHHSRRAITEFSHFIAAPFLDDRADLAAMLLAIEQWPKMNRSDCKNILFAATAAEEVGGHGALWLLQEYRPSVGIALEVGPRVPDNPFRIDSQPTVWVNDSYSAMQARDIELVAQAAKAAKVDPHWQVLSRGGSDASCAASHGLVARPITLAFAAENSHGYEIMHRNSLPNLSRLLLETLSLLCSE